MRDDTRTRTQIAGPRTQLDADEHLADALKNLATGDNWRRAMRLASLSRVSTWAVPASSSSADGHAR